MIGWLTKFANKGKAGGSVPINLSGLVLLTGVPGAGKTLRMVEYMEAALKAGRPVYACNVDGLNMPGVIPFDDPHQWQDLPPNSVLFVDEAQRYFRARRGMVDPPASITAMETIRHDGVCIVMTTQQPTYLDKHIRGLIGRHEHLVEIVAGSISNVYAFRSCREEITPSSLSDAEFKAWAHPKRLHGAYKSAEVHTKRLILSTRAWLLIGMTLACIAFVTYAFSGDAKADSEEAQASQEAGLPATPSDNGGPISTMAYLAKFKPRIEGAPWSAPAYDDMQVADPPRIACMIGSECRCITDQGTRYEIRQRVCRKIVESGGVWNPYKSAEEVAAATAGAGQGPAAEGATAPAVAGVAGSDTKPVTGYGGMRGEGSGPSHW